MWCDVWGSDASRVLQTRLTEVIARLQDEAEHMSSFFLLANGRTSIGVPCGALGACSESVVARSKVARCQPSEASVN